MPRSTKAFYCVPTVKPVDPDLVAYNCTFKGADTATFIKLHLPGQVRPGLSRLQSQVAATPASAATSGSSTSTRRGEATSRALSAVIAEEDGGEDQRLPAPAPGEQAEPEQAEADQGPVERLPEPALASRRAGRATRAARPWWRRSRQVLERLLAEVVPELVLAPCARAPGRFRAPGSARRRAGRGSAPGAGCSRVGRVEEPRVARDHLGPDLLRVPVRGQVGAGEQHLPAAGRDRHDAVEGDRVADRPGGDDERRRRRAGSPPAPSPRRQSDPGAARRRRRARAGTTIPRYSGRTIAGGPEQRRREATSAPSPSRSRGPEQRQHRAREQRRRQRLAHQHPLVLEQRRIDRHRGRRDQPRAAPRSMRLRRSTP